MTDFGTTPPPGLPAALVTVLRGLPRLAVAFSGGLDSRFLCHAALLCGCDVLAVHAQGPHIAAQESAEAEAWAQKRGLRLLVAGYSPLALPEVAENSTLRCYGCKKGLVALLRGQLAALENEDGPRVLCDGTNADDLSAYRPGLRALAEGGVRSPLAEAGLSKPALREAARATGLDRPDQRARPCLLTRLAYGLRPEAATLERLAACEDALAALEAPVPGVAKGGVPALGDFRLRLAPLPVLQAEHLPDTLRPQVEAVLRAYGFWPCAFKIGGAISGFYDAATGNGARRAG